MRLVRSSSLRTVAMTCQRSRRNRSVVTRPKPEEQPVIAIEDMCLRSGQFGRKRTWSNHIFMTRYAGLTNGMIETPAALLRRFFPAGSDVGDHVRQILR